MKNFACKQVLVLVFLMVFWPMFLQAHQQQQPDPKELQPVSRTYAIINANITQAPGRKIERGTVVIKEGLILSVGKNISVPPDAIIIKGDSLFIYAGFIDGLSRTGVTKPKEDPNPPQRPKDPGNPQPDIAGITPQNDVRGFLNPADKTIEELRAIGFATAQVVAYGGMLPGTASIILLNGKTPDEMTLVGKSAMFSALAPAQRVYPNTVIGVIAKWRELYKQAIQLKNYESMYASNRTGLNRGASDRMLEALYPVIDKKIPVIFEADDYLDVHRVLVLQSEFGFPLQIGNIKQGWDAISKLKMSGTKIFLSLNLPEDKIADAKAEKKDGVKKDSVKIDTPVTKPDPEKEALEKRKAESIKMYASQAAEFQKAGISFGFSTLTSKTTDLNKN